MEYLQYQSGDNPNLGHLFNRVLPRFLVDERSYRGASYEFIQLLERVSLDVYRRYYASLERDFEEFGGEALTTFSLDVRYPGLLAGLGYSHSTGKSEDEMKLGFSFDHSTGLPILPGSSLKGQLRSFFPGRYTDSGKKEEVEQYLHSIFTELGLWTDLDAPTFFEKINQLEHLIFEGIVDVEKKTHLHSLEQDTFFDVFPKVEANVRKKFMALESITPHPHPLENPLPLRMLKIAPGVSMQFTFRLNDHGLPRRDKERLFKTLLLRHGAGAKTRTGFGQFMNPEALQALQKDEGTGYLTNFAPSQVSKSSSGSTSTGKGNTTPPPPAYTPSVDRSIHSLKEAKRGKSVKALVKNNTGGMLQLQLVLEDYNKTTQLKYFKSSEMEIGKEILVDIADIQGKGDKATLIVNNPRKIS